MSENPQQFPRIGDQGRQPRVDGPYSPFELSYEIPNDQFGVEMDLLDSFEAQYPDEAPLLHGFLTRVKKFSGMQIQDLRLDRPVDGLRLTPEGYIDGEQHMILSNIALKRASAEDERLETLDGTTEELERYAASRDTLSVQEGDIPPYSRAMIDGVYALVGAQVVHTRKEDGAGLVVRKGMYHGEPVYFEEMSRRSESNGVTSYTLAMLDEKHALFDINDELYGDDLQECMRLTGLSRYDVLAMNRSGEITRGDFREQAVLIQAVEGAMTVED